MQVMLTVDVSTETNRTAARVLEVSARGLRIQVSGGLADQQRVIIRRGEVVIPGRVVWRSGSTLGIEFDEEINEHLFLRFKSAAHRASA